MLKKKERCVYQPEYFPNEKAKKYEIVSPSIYIAKIRNAIVHGSGLVLVDDVALNDICANATENRVQYRSGSIRKRHSKFLYVESSNDVGELDEAINLCGIATDNYYHLTFEVLSRYEYVKAYIGDRNIPILLNEEAKSSLSTLNLLK